MLHPEWSPEVFLEGMETRRERLSREHRGPRAVLNAIARIADSYQTACDALRRELAVAENQLRDYQARIGKPFFYETYLANLTSLRDQLRAVLSGTGQGEDTQLLPKACDLAEDIKTLQASNRIEATPERTGTRRSSTEVPVTMRIRRRLEGVLAT